MIDSGYPFSALKETVNHSKHGNSGYSNLMISFCFTLSGLRSPNILCSLRDCNLFQTPATTPEASNSDVHSPICGKLVACVPTPEVLNTLHFSDLFTPAFIVKDIKLASHKMILNNRKLFSHFNGWQVGYSGFTYHISSKPYLIKYVENQREHHKIVTFKDELVELLKEHSVDYNEYYLFI